MGSASGAWTPDRHEVSLFADRALAKSGTRPHYSGGRGADQLQHLLGFHAHLFLWVPLRHQCTWQCPLYSPECVEGEFSELRLYRLLQSSCVARSPKVAPKVATWQMCSVLTRPTR
jgi:hypothetical protein